MATTTKKSVTSTANKAVDVTKNTVNTVNEEVQTTDKPTVTTPSFAKKSEKYIPMDAMVMVRNATGGKLIYTSKRLAGYEETWFTFGEEIPMEMQELYSMKNTDRRFFTENWIEVDPLVLKDLGMEKFYDGFISIDQINDIYEMSADEIIETVGHMKESCKTAFALNAIEKVENKELTDITVINAIENALGCHIYEH